jgi:hypothetical protein
MLSSYYYSDNMVYCVLSVISWLPFLSHIIYYSYLHITGKFLFLFGLQNYNAAIPNIGNNKNREETLHTVLTVIEFSFISFSLYFLSFVEYTKVFNFKVFYL